MHAKKLSPIVSEFETQAEADSYDRWFREKVAAAKADTRPGVPHDEAMSRISSIIANARAKRAVIK